MPLKSLIKEAYGIENDQILGAPSWLNTQTYDIEAKVDGADADSGIATASPTPSIFTAISGAARAKTLIT
jgi:hypothetical protein